MKITAALALAAVGWAAAGEPAFDQGVKTQPLLEQARAGAAAMAAPKGASAEEEKVWISVAREDLPGLAAAGLPMGASILSGLRLAVYRVDSSFLPVLSSAMHERFNKCGGFFAHATRAEAEEDLKPAPPAAAAERTIDQAAAVKPLVAAVREAELRATIADLSARHDRYYQSAEGAAAAVALAARWRELLKSVPGATVELVTHEGWKQPSVMAVLPGADLSAETVVLGGHLDSINARERGSGRAPGADDNASGIAVLTETLRVLAEGGFRPRRTIAVIGYAAKEVGLRGSADIAKRWRAEGRAVAGVIQFDMTNFAGSGDKLFLVTDNVEPALTAYLGRLSDAYSGAQRGEVACGYACSDHASWTRNGYPASAAFESSFDGVNPNIHTDRDTLANAGANAAHSVKFAKLAVAFAVETAKAAPPR